MTETHPYGSIYLNNNILVSYFHKLAKEIPGFLVPQTFLLVLAAEINNPIFLFEVCKELAAI
jgi:hypothetical protein